MRIFITGATGFIGQALVKRLSAEGHEIVAWVRSMERARAQLGEEVTLLNMNATDEALADALKDCDGAVNLAGAPVVARWSQAYRKELVTSRVTLTERLTRGMQGSAVKVLVSSSAVGYYGDRGEERLVESSAPAEGFLAKLCVDWERAATEGVDAECRVVLLRTGIVLGQEGGALEKMLLPFKAGVGGPIGSGKQFMPWIHIDDMVGIIVKALEDASYEGVFNASAPQPVSNTVFTKALGRALKRPTFMWVPTFGLKALYGEATGVLVASQMAVPEALLNQGFKFSFEDLDAALNDILN